MIFAERDLRKHRQRKLRELKKSGVPQTNPVENKAINPLMQGKQSSYVSPRVQAHLAATEELVGQLSGFLHLHIIRRMASSKDFAGDPIQGLPECKHIDFPLYMSDEESARLNSLFRALGTINENE